MQPARWISSSTAAAAHTQATFKITAFAIAGLLIAFANPSAAQAATLVQTTTTVTVTPVGWGDAYATALSAVAGPLSLVRHRRREGSERILLLRVERAVRAGQRLLRDLFLHLGAGWLHQT